MSVFLRNYCPVNVKKHEHFLIISHRQNDEVRRECKKAGARNTKQKVTHDCHNNKKSKHGSTHEKIHSATISQVK